MSTSDSAFPFERFRRLRFGAQPHCPHCHATRVHRWGGFSGRRRYRCVACRRTFSDFTGTPLATLKHIDRWPDFCHCMLASLSVRRTATLLGVDKNTAFRWRHRVLPVLDASDTAPLGSSVFFHETWFPHSEKGSRDLDRPPRHRAAFRRMDMTPVWVLIARDGCGRVVSDVVGPLRPGASELEAALRPRLDATIEFVSTFGPYGAAGILAVRLERSYRRAGLRAPESMAVRRYIMALRRWLKRFRGVATRYLPNYLAWHRFLEAHGDAGGGYRWLLAARFP
ncbi:MAG: IS1595 family transposase [Longimicrobiales bacterium]